MASGQPGQSAAQQKIAERLTILNDRGQGLLIRLYNIKKRFGNAESRPSFLNDKSLEPAIKLFMKKYPALDTKSSGVQPLVQIKEDVSRHLSVCYFTFIDIMDFKSHVEELLSRIDGCQIQFDITLNFDLTRAYLEMISCYVSIMLLLTQVDDRKLLISLFELTLELQSQPDKSFPRLAQLFIDYDDPLRKLAEDFVPHARCVAQALLSLRETVARRLMKADEWRAANTLSLLAESLKMGEPQAPTPTDYVAHESLERWVVFSYMVCYSLLNDEIHLHLWKMTLTNSFVIALCRDEVLQIHSYITDSWQTMKGSGFTKRVAELKEWYVQATITTVHHRERRKYLRLALRELVLMFEDQPGLLGPKAAVVFSALSFARDEVCWLLRHSDYAPLKKSGAKINSEDLIDRMLPELLFNIENLRQLVRKYSQVVQRYHIGYLSEFDSYEIADIFEATTFPPDESVILQSFVADLRLLLVEHIDENVPIDLRGLRLDWMRLQAYMSMERAQRPLKDQRRLADLLNTVAFHSKMVDNIDETLLEASDLSLYCFYITLMQTHFKHCVEFPSQERYALAFPMVTSHFINACHEQFCPEEMPIIGSLADQYALYFVRIVCDEACQLFFKKVCEHFCQLSSKLLPKQAVALMVQSIQSKKKGKKPQAGGGEAAASASAGPSADSVISTVAELPGAESVRKDRDKITDFDKVHMCLVELCTAINSVPYLQVYERGVIPAEMFSKLLEFNCNGAFASLVSYNPNDLTKPMARPSEVLHSMKTIMDAVRTLECYVQIDVLTVVSSALLYQTRMKDGVVGDPTIASHFIDFYFDLIQKAITCPVVFSPLLHAFVSVTSEMMIALHASGVGKSSLARHSTIQSLSELSTTPTHENTPVVYSNIVAENYTSYAELRALAELIGPLGVQLFHYRITGAISQHLEAIKKVIVTNRETLREIRKNATRPARMRELSQKLQNAEVVLQRMTIIGVFLSFRRLLMQALKHMLESRAPFLFQSASSLKSKIDADQTEIAANEMLITAGFETSTDVFLQASLKDRRVASADDDYEVSSLLFVCIGACLPRLAQTEGSVFLPQLHAHLNNIHCLAVSINAIANELFAFHGKGDTFERLTEFLSIASANLLYVGQDAEDSGVTKMTDSLYILLDLIVRESAYLSPNQFEKLFPYVLLRNAYNSAFKIAHVEFGGKH